MKTSKTLSALMTMCLIIVVIYACKKPNNQAPIADNETQSAIDAVWATFAITDIEQVTAFVGENEQVRLFYSSVPGGFNPNNQTGFVKSTRNPADALNYNIAFYHSWCMDGRLRDGTIFCDLNHDPLFDQFTKNGIGNPNARYTHDFASVNRISFQEYTVDGWKIDNDPTKIPRAFVVNLMASNDEANKTPFKWRIRGDFDFTSPDPLNRDKDMKISVEIFKTLVNSNDIRIYNQNQTGAFIKWTNADPYANTPTVANAAALVAYTGTICGTTSNGSKFRMVIDEANPLIRDFTCYADKIGGTNSGGTANSVVPRYNEFHPFIKGIVSFTTGLDQTGIEDVYVGKSSIYPRQIYFGNEDNIKDAEGNIIPPQCDNTGMVLIKGIGYKVEFKK